MITAYLLPKEITRYDPVCRLPKVDDLDCTSTPLMPWTARQSGTR